MIDFQTIFIRDVAELSQINFIAVLRIETDNTSGLSEVLINGLNAKYMRGLDGRTIFAHLPSGVSQSGVSDVRIKRVSRSETGDTELVEIIDTGSGFLDPYYQADPNSSSNPVPVSFYSGVLELVGSDFSKTQRVKVNSTDVPYSVISESRLMCAIPDGSTTIDSVDVITTSTTINRRTYFEYMVGESPTVVAGMQKLIQQFVKLLMTTPGSDVFNPTSGAGLQGFVGTNFSPQNPSSLVAQVTLRILQCGIDMTARQTIAGIPSNERLSDVEVLGIDIDPDDPTIMQVSLRLNTFGGRSAQVSTMLGEAVEYVTGSAASTVSAATSGY